MKLNYRIKKWAHPFADTYYTAQYKILGIWFNINTTQTGRLSKPSSTICETFDDAKSRIETHIKNMETHIKNMERAKDWMDRSSTVVWEGNSNSF